MSGLAPSQQYIYGRPVRPDEFLGRTNELRTTFNRIKNVESTAIVGDPHIGKTSFLMKLADQDAQKFYLGRDRDLLILSSIDLHPVSSGYTVNDFWEEALYG